MYSIDHGFAVSVARQLAIHVLTCMTVCFPPMDMQFLKDVEVIYNNCIEYNGEDSDYAELAQEMIKTLATLSKTHFEGGVQDPAEEEDVGPGRKKKRPNSPSPELTSESSSEEESNDRCVSVIQCDYNAS